MSEDNFFKPYGNKIDFLNQSDLLSKVSQIDDSVPGRTDGRKSYHRERYSIVRYLRHLAANNLFDYPFSIIKDESPDFFLLYSDNIKVGIEHRDIASRKYQAALAALEKAPPGSMLESSFFNASDDDFTKDEIEAAIRKPGDELIGEGFDGDILEKHWVELVLSGFKDKTVLINKDHFKDADYYELILEDVTHVSMLHDAVALKMIKEEAKNIKNELVDYDKQFNKVHVISGDKLFFDILGSPQLYFLREENEV